MTTNHLKMGVQLSAEALCVLICPRQWTLCNINVVQ